MKKQQGVSLTGMIIAAFIIVLVAIAGFKIVPAYLEYQTVKKIFKSMAEDPELKNATRRDIERVWAARTAVDNVASVRPEDIEFTKGPNGPRLEADYSVKSKLFGNISACIDFHPTSD